MHKWAYVHEATPLKETDLGLKLENNCDRHSRGVWY